MGDGRYLLATSNGAGLGHLTRVMAVADQLPTGSEVTIFTMSSAVGVPIAQGFSVEHLPSPGYLGMEPAAWHFLLEDRMEFLLDQYDPEVVLFDGVSPYRGLVDVLRRRRPTSVWQRRAMWRAGVGAPSMEMEKYFGTIVEPGEYAAEIDRGLTATTQREVVAVDPVVYLPEELLQRTEACEELGLDPSRRHVLVQLGAGTINDVDSIRNRVTSAVLELTDRDVSIVSNPLNAPSDVDPRVNIIQRYPLVTALAAFDYAFMASGYNSFHESLSVGLPTVFVPNLDTKTDDQDARSRWAEHAGVGLRWDSESGLDSIVTTIDDEEHRRRMAALMADTLAPARGAEQIAQHLESLR